MGIAEASSSTRRILAVLKSFSPENAGLTITKIAQISGVSRATTYRIVAELLEERFLYKNSITAEYSLGPEVYFLGSIYLSTTNIMGAAEPVLKTINGLTGKATNLGIYDNGQVTLLMKEETKGTFRLAIHIGSIVPAYASSMGKAFLSELSESEIDQLYPEEELKTITSRTISNKSSLKNELYTIKMLSF